MTPRARAAVGRGAGQIAPEHREIRARLEQPLAELASSGDLVTRDVRDWWLSYLSSHERHLLQLISLTEEWGPAPQNSFVLDVGSFPGHYAALLARLGYRVAAVDLDPDRAFSLWARFGISSYARDIEIEELPCAAGSVDFVTFSEVLEHLRVNPFWPLREVYRVLRPGGRLLLSVPYVSPRHRIRFAVGRDYQGDVIAEFRSLDEIGHMGHYRLLSRSEVRRMLTHCGFEIRLEQIAGWLPGGRWSFVRYLWPLRDRFRSHLYLVAEKL